MTVSRRHVAARPELRPHRRQRHRARGQGSADQRPPDVAAVPAGARLGEQRHGHLRRHPLQRPRRASRTSSATTASRARAIIDASPGNLNGEVPSPFRLQASLENVQEFRVESSNYPAEYGTGTGGQISVVTKSGAQRVPRLGFRVLPQRPVRRAELLRHRQVAARATEPVRRVGRRAAQEGPRVLLRQLRRLPPGMPASTSSRRCRARRRGRAPCRRCCRSEQASSDLARSILPGASDQPRLRHRAAAGERHRQGERVQRAARSPAVQRTGASMRRYFRDEGTNTQPEGVTGRTSYITANAAERGARRCRASSGRRASTSSRSATTPPTRHRGLAPTVNGIDLSQIIA